MGKRTSSRFNSEAQLSERVESGLRRSLQWLKINRDDFAFTHISDWREQILLLKPFSEFVLTLHVLHTLGHDVADHMKWAWEQLRDGDYLLEVMIARPDLADLVGLYANFHEYGYRNDRLATWLTYIKSLKSTNAIESSLWSRIAHEYNFQRLGLGESLDKLMSQSWLENDPEPWTISDGSAYSVTHEVFYITDFGTKPDCISAESTELLNLWLPVWAHCFADEGNWDVVSELLMVSFCIRDSSWVGRFLMQMLEAQLSDGMFLGPPGAGRILINTECSESRRRFLSNYHTTLVGLMTLAMFSKLARHVRHYKL